MTVPLQTRVISSISEIPAICWNKLSGTRYPFLRHEFLDALERCQCLGEASGWYPRHLIVEDKQQLIAAVPMYLKENSFGEFVFDWSWADAYHRSGKSYYPKLVIAVPFTPATGPRILVNQDCEDTLYRIVLRAAIQFADSLEVSSLHCLFPLERETVDISDWLPRWGYQFHWQNNGYEDFSAFLAGFSSRKRKNVRRERHCVELHGIEIRRIAGSEASEHEWAIFYQFYRSTFGKHGNYPALSEEFFRTIGSTMGEQVLLIFAYRNGQPIAGSFFLIGDDTLYGRYWGCCEEIPNLHFELCYYQGLDYCIERGLKTFEPGAQGEHKISRGFLPTKTYSLHWIREPRFRAAIDNFIARERLHVDEYIDQLRQRSPFKQSRC